MIYGNRRNTLYNNRDDFRKWLIQNHQTKKEIWLIQYKKATKKPSINYVEAVEEAICFGWIDGFEKGMDSGTLCHPILAPAGKIELDEHKQGPRPKNDRRRQDDTCRPCKTAGRRKIGSGMEESTRFRK